MTATLKIDADEREALHGLLVRRLTILVESDRELAAREGVSVDADDPCLFCAPPRPFSCLPTDHSSAPR